MADPTILNYAALGLSQEEYRAGLTQERIHYKEHISDGVENRYHIETTYILESTFIEINLEEIQIIMNTGDIMYIGKHSAEILSDNLYRGIAGISRDIIGQILSNFKKIDIEKVGDLNNLNLNNN
jgi:hypothetical protein